jgi:hypothetical protein
MHTFFITSVLGFVGRTLIAMLIGKGYRVRAAVRYISGAVVSLCNTRAEALNGHQRINGVYLMRGDAGRGPGFGAALGPTGCRGEPPSAYTALLRKEYDYQNRFQTGRQKLCK